MWKDRGRRPCILIFWHIWKVKKCRIFTCISISDPCISSYCTFLREYYVDIFMDAPSNSSSDHQKQTILSIHDSKTEAKTTGTHEKNKLALSKSCCSIWYLCFLFMSDPKVHQTSAFKQSLKGPASFVLCWIWSSCVGSINSSDTMSNKSSIITSSSQAYASLEDTNILRQLVIIFHHHHLLVYCFTGL